jgi:(S)-3,5-dihydroxyphenylglycine transaminase
MAVVDLAGYATYGGPDGRVMTSGRRVLCGSRVRMGQDIVGRAHDIVVDALKDAMRPTDAFHGPGVGHAEPGLCGDQAPSLARQSAEVLLDKRELHSSVSDPVLDTVNFLNEVTLRYPDAISFAPGRPYDGFFDAQEIFEHIRRYVDHLVALGYPPEKVRDALFQYGPASGRIRELIAEYLRQDENIEVAPESIVVTVGCQEAMFVAVRALVAGPEDVLLVPSPCYVGITGAARLLDIAVTTVPERQGGLHAADLEAVVRAERAAGRRPKACYVLPDHANPSGNTMSLEARHALLECAARLDILILEDSPYRLVSPGRQLPTLKSLDRNRRVVHLGSFSKTLFPGARVGFAVADQPVNDGTGHTGLLADELAKIKSMITVNTSPLSQAAVAGMLLASAGRVSTRNARISAYYGEAMRLMLRQLDAHFPAARRTALNVGWNRPAGGFFLTVDVPFPAGDAQLARSADEFGVIWTPMSYFYPQGGGTNAIRLSISCLSEAEIVDGVARLARFIETEIQVRAGRPGPGRVDEG